MLLEGESVQEEMGTGAAAQAAEAKYTVKTARRKCRDVMACNCSLVNAKPGCLKSAIVIPERYAASMGKLGWYGMHKLVMSDMAGHK